MKKYDTVEDYLEVLAGYRDPVSGKLSNNWFLGFSPIISLARYDVDVLTSMSEASSQNKALTEKQGTLLCNILLKYQRQLAAKSIDVTPIETPVWRLPLRKMDYTRSLTLRDDKIAVRFPFDTKLIDEMKGFRSQSQGGSSFDREAKLWMVALTEYNLNWLHTWATNNKFIIDPEIESMNNLILEAEKVPHPIELRYGETQLEITNASSSLTEYVNNNYGGFSHDNLLPLLDATGILGVTVEQALQEVVNAQWGYHTMVLASNKEVQIKPLLSDAMDKYEQVLEYAVSVNRLPVVIYEPDMSYKLYNKLVGLYPTEDICEVKGQKRPTIPDTAKFVYTTVPLRNIDRVPMLITSSGMIYGGDKQMMAQRSEKVVFIASEIYNSSGGSGNKPRKIIKL